MEYTANIYMVNQFTCQQIILDAEHLSSINSLGRMFIMVKQYLHLLCDNLEALCFGFQIAYHLVLILLRLYS